MEEDTEHQPLIFAHSCVLICTNSHAHTHTHNMRRDVGQRPSLSGSGCLRTCKKLRQAFYQCFVCSVSYLLRAYMCDINPVIKTICFNIMLRKLNIKSQREVYINLFIRINISEIGFIQLLESLACFVEGPFVCVPALCMFLTPNKRLSSVADFVYPCFLCFIFFCCYSLSSRVFNLLVLSLTEKVNPISLASNMFRTSSQDCF